MKKNLLLLLCAILLIIVTACGKGGNSGGSQVSSDATFEKEDYRKVLSANNELSFKLLSEVEANEDGNTFVSPTSLLMALSMVYNGAEGVTKEEIAKVLAVEGIDVANASLIWK